MEARGQNLVPNGGFETITTCPSATNGEINDAPPWYSPNGQTPDLYNTCATINALQVPQNWTGWQVPHSGNGYGGFSAYNYAYSSSGINGREYISTQLLDTLTGGKNYCVEFYVSRADSSFWAINRVGACITKQNLTGPIYDTISATPQIKYDTGSIFLDTANWVRISGTYLASGGEKYITIGNFYADNQTDTLSHLGTWYWAYFYIDDVSVIDCGWSGIDSPAYSAFTLYPSPSNGNFQLSGDFPLESEFHIINSLGQEVVAPIPLPTGNQKVSIDLNLAEGVYVYRITSGKEILHEEKLVIAR
jgi:hypothetical protein